MRIFVIMVLTLVVSNCAKPYEEENILADGVSMKLEVISDYGSVVRTISDEATQEIVVSTMQSLDWGGFHQVVLTKPNGDWLEVGGSLNPNDGLSVMHEKNKTQEVIKTPPENVIEMTSFLAAYLEDTDEWREGVEWH